MNAVELQTERLILRVPRLEDCDSLAPLYADPAVMRYIGAGTTRSADQTRKGVEWMIGEHGKHGYGLWTTILKSGQRIIGRCGLIHQQVEGVDELEVAYLLAQDCWEQGLATEAALAIRNYALDVLKRRRLISLIHPENGASKKVAAKAGMHFERMVLLQDKQAELHSITR